MTCHVKHGVRVNACARGVEMHARSTSWSHITTGAAPGSVLASMAFQSCMTADGPTVGAPSSAASFEEGRSTYLMDGSLERRTHAVHVHRSAGCARTCIHTCIGCMFELVVCSS